MKTPKVKPSRDPREIPGARQASRLPACDGLHIWLNIIADNKKTIRCFQALGEEEDVSSERHRWRRSTFFWDICQHLAWRAHKLRSLAATLCTQVVAHRHRRPTRTSAKEPGRSRRSCPSLCLGSKGTHGLLDFQFDLAFPNDILGLLKRLAGTLDPGRHSVTHSGYSWIPGWDPRLQKIVAEVHGCIFKARIQSKWWRMRKEDARGLCVHGKFQSSPTRPLNE